MPGFQNGDSGDEAKARLQTMALGALGNLAANNPNNQVPLTQGLSLNARQLLQRLMVLQRVIGYGAPISCLLRSRLPCSSINRDLRHLGACAPVSVLRSSLRR